MTKEVVVVTGSSGLVGRYVVSRLQQNPELVKEIRLIDREHRSFKATEGVHLRHFPLDLCDAGALERALSGSSTVIHCAHAPLPVEYQDKQQRKQMWKDTVEATEILLEKMYMKNVNRLIYVGDAYSSLPVEDNYGLGVELFSELPKTFLLGEYGEARARAEMFARKEVRRNDKLDGIFLRPVFVHGQGGSRLLRDLSSLAVDGNLPFIPGDRRGMHQFIYAGNLSAIIEKSLTGLIENPQKFSNEVVYCMDETNLYSMRKFIQNRIKSENFCEENGISFTKSWIFHYYHYWRHSLGFEVPKKTMNYPLFRLVFEKSVGFSIKTQRLLLDFKPEISQEKAFQLSEEENFDRMTIQG